MTALAAAGPEPGEKRPGRLTKGRVRVLVVDDEPQLRRTLGRVLGARGIEVLSAPDGASALKLLRTQRIDVVLADVMMPNMGGIELLHCAKKEVPNVEVIMMTAYGNVETAVEAVRTGAFHFLTKPFRSNDEVVLSVMKATEHRQLAVHAARLERRLEEKEALGELIGSSAPMREVYRLSVGVAPTSSTVLILGESGTGKELTARAIHDNSPRTDKPFVAVNCSAIPDNLVETELFGHERGAFTGATSSRSGLFEAANGGTLFLDEIGDLPRQAQVKLLRALQEGEIKRIGSNDTRRVDVRVIAATNVSLRERVHAGAFREDLYYRLNVVEIELPPLRHRQDDIPLLAQHFLTKFAKRASQDIREISPVAMRLLQQHGWPGNVRELENAMERAVVFCRGTTIHPEHLPFTATTVVDHESEESEGHSIALPANLPDAHYRDAKQQVVHMFDRYYFTAVLRRTGGNVSEAARASGLDRSNFRRAARRAGVDTRVVRDSSEE